MNKIYQNILNAEQRIRPFVRETELEYSPFFSQKTESNVYLKCEMQQYTGAFKVRGAFNKMMTLSSSALKNGVIAASTGNHGAAVSYASNKLGVPVKIFVPENASKAKVDNILQYGASLELYGTNCLEAEQYARQYAQNHNMTYISPYNDQEVIEGQGTLAVELIKQLPSIDAVLVPVGGGGLISGIGTYLKTISPHTKIIGCLPANSPVMAESIKAGHLLDTGSHQTLSDATAGAIESGSITFDLCRSLVDDFLIVSEDEIKAAMITFTQAQHKLIEGAAGLVIAGLCKHPELFHNKNVALVLSGCNISLGTLREVLAE